MTVSGREWKKWVALPVLGAVIAIVFKVFEFIVNEGTVYIWNGLFQTDLYRWGVIPLAIALSTLFSLLLRITKSPRTGVAEPNPLAAMNQTKPVLFRDVALVFVIGAASLLAGASLGPEASLVGISVGLSLWTAQLMGVSTHRKIFALAGMGSLLVVFCGSILPILMPILLIFKQQKKFSANEIIPVLIAGFSTYFVLWLLNHDVVGYGSIPLSGGFTAIDYVSAFTVGIVAAGAGYTLKYLIGRLEGFAKLIDAKSHWAVAAGVFGLVLGLLYLIGGESVQFSGSKGTHLLLAQQDNYTLWAFAGLVLVKLAVTAWSLAVGYRGGLVFPSVYVGFAASLLLIDIDPNFAGPGILIGSVAGIFSALTGSAALALIFVLSLLPITYAGIVIAGIIGAIAGNKLLTKSSISST